MTSVKKNHRSFFTSFNRIHAIFLVLFICLLPGLLNILGLDFSSVKTPISEEKIANNSISANDLFYALSGALHHAILEWSAVIVAMLVFIVSLVHYRVRGDMAIPIIGMALLCAGAVDAFHTLAATRIIEANAPNTDFIPFTWAFSRIFNASIMIIGTLLSLWIHQKKLKNTQPNSELSKDDEYNNRKELKILFFIGVCFFASAYFLVHLAANSENLPQTMFKGALITRPYDVLPLGLFFFAAALFWNLYRINPSLAKFGLLLSVIPELTTQIHMAFGSTALFDNNFNIAHALKVIAYGCVFIGIVFDLITRQSLMTLDITSENQALPLKDEVTDDLIDIGKVNVPLSLQIPIAAFSLALSIAVLVSVLFYSESELLLKQQESRELAIETELIEPMIEQLYEKARTDILFLSKLPSIAYLIKAKSRPETLNLPLWQEIVGTNLVELINVNPFYHQIQFIGLADKGREIIKVERNSHISESFGFITPLSRLKQRGENTFFKSSLTTDFGHVNFSKISLNKKLGEVVRPNKALLQVSTPIFDDSTEKLFGVLIIDIDFGYFSQDLKSKELSRLSFYLANQQGDFIFHPDVDKTFGFDLGQRHFMQKEFPQLESAFQENLGKQSLINLTINEKRSTAQYSYLLLDKFESEHPLRLLVLGDSSVFHNALETFKTRSVLLGLALGIVALGLAIVAARRVTSPLSEIIQSLENYQNTGKVENLPVKSRNEFGVLARNFHNLFARISHAMVKQKQLADDAERAAEKVNAVFESAADAFITFNEQGYIQFFNRAAETMFNYGQVEIIGHPIKTLMPELACSLVEGSVVFKTSEILSSTKELTALRKSSEVFPIHLAISEIQLQQGNILIAIIRDKSKEQVIEQERAQRELEIQQINKRIALATEAASIGVWEYDLASDVSDWDERMFSLYGIEKSDFSDHKIDWLSFVHPDDVESALAVMSNAITEKKNFEDEYRIKLPSGEVKFIKAVGVVNCDDKGDAVQLIGVNYDISKVKVAEQAHIQAKELAEDTARHKAEFLASMSHEIRTPMNGVLGMLGLLMRSELTDEQRHRAKLANSSAESLLTLINDILDFSKVEAGKLDLEILDFDIRSLLGEFSETMAFRCQDKGLEIILDVSQITFSHVKGDPGRIRQILSNLVGNAIKFTEQGEIVIRAQVQLLENQELLFTCSISDTGIGIPEEKLAEIFDSFSQVDASTTRQYGGTGLGLAISRRLCDLMGGEIDVESEAKKGSCFTFKLTLARSNQGGEVIPDVNIKGVELLIVDDNKTNREVLRQQLELWGANVTEAEHGLVALAILEKASRPDFKVAFLDMQMPYMNGAELGQHIRQLSHLKELKLVMMTSMASRGDAKYFADLGFDAYFPKPATTSDLFDTLALTLNNSELIAKAEPLITHHYLQGLNRKPSSRNDVEMKNVTETYFPENEQRGNGKISSGKNLEKCRLLLVEDNRINQEVARFILAEFGVNADVAADGLEALQSLKVALLDMPYDLILMDCQMPEMDGYQATKAIRAGDAGDYYINIPIIAMTANAMKGDKEKCINAGMNDYLSKPIEQKLLRKKLRYWYKSTESSTTEVERNLEGKSHDNLNDSSNNNSGNNTDICSNNKLDNSDNINIDTANGVLHWDKSALLKRVSNNEKMAQKLIELFLQEMPNEIEQFSQAYRDKSEKNLLACTHKIKGVCANVSAKDLNQKAVTLESAIKSNEMNAEHYHTFISSYQSIRQLLENELSQ